MQSNAFHDTLHLSQPELPLFEARTQKQDKLVLSIFEEHKGSWLTPPYVHAIVKARTGHDVPLTSIRRAISNLSKHKPEKEIYAKLLKSGMAVSKGLYGVNNHSWTYKL